MATTYTPIATTNGTGSSGTVTFSSISGSYTDLILVASMYGTIDDTGVKMTFNSDVGNNYSYTILRGNGSAASSHRASNVGRIDLFYNNGLGSTNGVYAPAIISIQNYSNATTYKTSLSRSFDQINSGTGEVLATVGLWRNTNAITSITLTTTSGNFTSGSTFTLYGILSA